MELKKFVIPKDFAKSPYKECLQDVSQGMPKSMVLRSLGINQAHKFSVNEQGFYEQLARAENHAMYDYVKRMQRIALDDFTKPQQSIKALEFLIGLIKDDDPTINNRINAIISRDAYKQESENVEKHKASLGYEYDSSIPAFYKQFGTH